MLVPVADYLPSWVCSSKSLSLILWTGGAESVTKGESLFAFSVSSALTVQGRKGLNHTGQAD